MTHVTPKNFGFVIKHKVKGAAKVAVEAAEFLVKNNCTIFVENDADEFFKHFKNATPTAKNELPTKSDIVVVFGGDGTFLSIARQMIWKSVPILGINAGSLGFLTEVKLDETIEMLTNVLKGEYTTQQRGMLEACVKRQNKQLFCLPALNDVVINKSAIARIIRLKLVINGVFVSDVLADGMIFATPTGSTAYSLAAGGPLVHPQVPSIVITSICPHSLTIRPIVVPDSANISIEVAQKEGEIMLTLDGQFGYDLQQGDTITISKFKKHSVEIIQSPKRKYFELLQSKFALGARGES